MRMTRQVASTLGLLLSLGAIQGLADDRQLAFVRDGDIYLAYLDGSDAVRITKDADHPKRGLAWSHDGERLAYVRERKEEDGVVADVYLISVSVPAPRMVVDGSKLEAPGNAVGFTGAWSPSFDPGGQFLCFCASGGTEGGFLYRVDLTAEEFPAPAEQVKANRVFLQFRFAPEGQMAGHYSPYYPEGGHHEEICVAPAGKPEEFADISEPTGFDDAGSDYAHPAWSPDSKTVAAIHVPRDDICLFDLADQRHRLFVDGDALDRLDIIDAAWRPDGKGLYFTLLDNKTDRPHSIWYAPLSDPYDRDLVAMGAHSLAAGGSLKFRTAVAK